MPVNWIVRKTKKKKERSIAQHQFHWENLKHLRYSLPSVTRDKADTHHFSSETVPPPFLTYFYTMQETFHSPSSAPGTHQ